TIMTKFPDAKLINHIMDAGFGEPNQSGLVIAPLLSAGADFLLGQYNSALQDSQLAIKLDPALTDMYLLEGFAYCNLGNDAEAEKAYTQGLEHEPNYPLLLMMRAEVRGRLNNKLGALADLAQAQKTNLSPEFNALLESGVKGEVTCQTVLNDKPTGG